MPVLRHDIDINESSPSDAAKRVVSRISERRRQHYPPFHWFRNILKTPSWYVETYAQIRNKNPNIELLDAPTFFDLYRIFLKNHPDAAKGKIEGMPPWP